MRFADQSSIAFKRDWERFYPIYAARADAAEVRRNRTYRGKPVKPLRCALCPEPIGRGPYQRLRGFAIHTQCFWKAIRFVKDNAHRAGVRIA